jgi:alpha-D-xyloside xylohydrolase
MMDLRGQQGFIDTTNPETRAYVWERAKRNYFDKGVRLFWLDEAEPEYEVYDFDNYRYHMGSCLEVGNLYPMMYAKGFYDGMRASGMENVVNLVRCAWAGSQRYGALVWSGDIASTFKSLRFQLTAGLNMGLAGIPWWTTDIGGFHGGNAEDPEFRELFARWFEWGAFCPVMRLHGYRLPRQPQFGTTGGCECRSGAPNEVWSFGEEVYEICKKYLFIRESIRDEVRGAMHEAHETGAPVMRPMFFEFPGDEVSWTLEDQYMLGGNLLVAPVMQLGQRTRRVYLPESLWKPIEGGEVIPGGRWIDADAPLDRIPVFVRTKET